MFVFHIVFLIKKSLAIRNIMQLGDWKNTGTSLIQDQPPVLLKSTIKCNYGGVDIKITDCGQKCEPEEIDVVGAPVPSEEKVDVDCIPPSNYTSKFSGKRSCNLLQG
jgi:hypothetical protein